MLRILGGVAIAGVLVATQLMATAQPDQPSAAGAMKKVMPADIIKAGPGKGILVKTDDPALGRKLVEIARGAPPESYRVQGYETVQYGSLPMSQLQATKVAARSGIVIVVVGPHYYVILIYGSRAKAFQDRTLTALAAADRSLYTLDAAR